MLSLSCLSRQWETHRSRLISFIQVLSLHGRNKRIGRVADRPVHCFSPAPAPQMYKNTGWALILLDSQWGAKRDINVVSHWKLSEWKHAFAFWPVRNLKKALMDLLFLYPCRVNKIRSYSQNHCVAHQSNSWCSYYTCHWRGMFGFSGCLCRRAFTTITTVYLWAHGQK